MSAQLAGERADAQEAAPPAPPRRRRLTSRQRNAIVFGIIGLAFLIPLRGLLRSQGPPMEEGFMLVFPERVLHGDIPNQRLPPPLRAGEPLGARGRRTRCSASRCSTERLFGSLQQIGGRVRHLRAGPRAGAGPSLAVCGVIALVIIVPPIGLTALAWVGGVGLGLLGLAAGSRRRRLADRTPRAAVWALVGGRRCSASRCCSVSTSSSRSGSRRSRCVWGDQTRAQAPRFAAGSRHRRVAVCRARRDRRARRHVVEGMVLDPVFNLRGGRSAPDPAAVGPSRRVPAAAGRHCRS